MAHDWGHVMSSKVFKIVQLSAAHPQLEIDTTQTVSNLPWSKFMQIQLSPQHFETSSSSEWVARHVLTSPLQSSPSSSRMARHWSKRHLFFARLASPQGSPLTRRLTSLCAVAQHRSIDSCGCLCRCRNVLWCVVMCCVSVCMCVCAPMRALCGSASHPYGTQLQSISSGLAPYVGHGIRFAKFQAIQILRLGKGTDRKWSVELK